MLPLLILMSLCVCSMLMFPLMSQPLSLGLMFILFICFMCWLSAAMITAWYGYILFLIYIGALLVMFVYVAGLAPNILFYGSHALLFCAVSCGVVVTMIMYCFPFIDSSLVSDYSLYVDMSSMKIYGGELVSPGNISILVGLAIILLINLIAVVKICYYQKASLRPFSNSL